MGGSAEVDVIRGFKRGVIFGEQSRALDWWKPASSDDARGLKRARHRPVAGFRVDQGFHRQGWVELGSRCTGCCCELTNAGCTGRRCRLQFFDLPMGQSL